MKKTFLFIATMVLCQNLYAGDAGYVSETCTSDSKRTVLTSIDAYAENMLIYTLIIDGMPAIYDLRDPNVALEGDDGYLDISSKGKLIFSIDKSAGTITVHKDPRQGSIAMNNALKTPFTVKMACKSYWPEP